MVHEVWGQKNHPNGLDRNPVQILALSFFITGHHAPSRTWIHPKTRQEDFLYDTKSSWGLKSIFGEGWFSTCLAPLLLIFSKGMGQNEVSDQLLNRIILFLLQWGLNPFGFLMLVYPSETGLLPVAPMLFWLLPYLLNLNLTLPTCNRCSMLDLMDKCAERTNLTLVRGRYTLLKWSIVKATCNSSLVAISGVDNTNNGLTTPSASQTERQTRPYKRWVTGLATESWHR